MTAAKATKKGQPWSSEEVQFLKDNYGSKTVKEISLELKRGYGGVSYKVQQLGLNQLLRITKTEQPKPTVSAADRARNGRAIRAEDIPSLPVPTKKPWWKFWA